MKGVKSRSGSVTEPTAYPQHACGGPVPAGCGQRRGSPAPATRAASRGWSVWRLARLQNPRRLAHPLSLAQPRCPRRIVHEAHDTVLVAVLRIADAVLQAPASEETFQVLAQRAGISERSARRLFNAETGMSFANWRQQARLLLALEYLSAGNPIAEVADSLGYASASSFIAMFRKAFGLSPRRYLSVRKA